MYRLLEQVPSSPFAVDPTEALWFMGTYCIAVLVTTGSHPKFDNVDSWADDTRAGGQSLTMEIRWATFGQVVEASTRHVIS